MIKQPEAPKTNQSNEINGSEWLVLLKSLKENERVRFFELDQNYKALVKNFEDAVFRISQNPLLLQQLYMSLHNDQNSLWAHISSGKKDVYAIMTALEEYYISTKESFAKKIKLASKDDEVYRKNSIEQSLALMEENYSQISVKLNSILRSIVIDYD